MTSDVSGSPLTWYNPFRLGDDSGAERAVLVMLSGVDAAMPGFGGRVGIMLSTVVNIEIHCYTVPVKFLRVLALAVLTGGLVAQVTNVEWKARFFDTIGSPRSRNGSSEGNPVRLRVVSGTIQWQVRKGPAFEIPFPEVAAISYDVGSRNMAVAILDRVADAANSHACSFDCIAAVFVSPVFAPFKSQSHYVTVLWRSNSEEKRAVFRMSKSDCLSFAQSVSQASGRPWRDLAAERRKAHSGRQRR